MAGWVMDRKSSIECELMTLFADQLQFAREAALYVLNSRSDEEALMVFIEGLEPIVGGGALQRDEEGLSLKLIDSEDMAGEDGRMGFSGPRDIVSAPF